MESLDDSGYSDDSFSKVITISNEGSPKSMYSIDDIISNGDFGIQFYRGKLNNRPVAIIRIQVADVESERILEFEEDIMNKVIDHSNILRYLNIEMDQQFLYLATEKWDWTLKDLVEGKLPEEESVFSNEKSILLQVTEGLAYLHEKGIIHRDIKPANIVIYKPLTAPTTINETTCPIREINNGPRVKLANFAICNILMKVVNNKSPIGSQGWIPPELYKNDETITSKSDIFSLGVLFYYTLTGGMHPFGRIPLEQTFRIQKMNDNQSSLLSETSASHFKSPYFEDREVIIKLIESMCKKSPAERPTANLVLNNIFFDKLSKNLSISTSETQKIESLVTNLTFHFNSI